MKGRITKQRSGVVAAHRELKAYATVLLGSAVSMALQAQTLTTLASFNGTNGSNPQSSGSSLVQGTDGNFYGTTLSGGTAGFGSVFKITPTGTLTNLYTFCTVPNCTDGAGPLGGLVRGTDGNFYGTTSEYGPNGHGAVFKITPGGTLTTLSSFGGGGNENSGANGVVQGADGNFYGTTSLGGQYGGGTVFKVTPSGALSTLYNFGSSSNDGIRPFGSLVQGGDGNFYGTTSGGGGAVRQAGTVFKITPGGTLTILYNFSGFADGVGPAAGLAQGTDGNFYGTTLNGGGNNAGTVYRVTPAGTLTTLYNFCSQSPACQDGSEAQTALIQAADGNLYGTTFQGGTNNYGTVFKVTASGAFTTIHSFSAVPDGAHPSGALFQGTDGNLYGATSGDGASVINVGTVFRLQLSASASYTCTNAAPPVITSIDSASAYGGYSYFASGTWLEIKGTNLADPADPRLTAATNPGQWISSDFNGANAPTSLDGISVSVNGRPAYVWYLSTGQLNVQAPEDTAAGNVAITVTNCKATSPPVMFARRALAPGFLAPTNYTANGTQYMVATFASDGAYVLNTSTGAGFGLNSRPAKSGDLIVAYGIGFGDVTPSILPGIIVGQSNTLANPVTISFGATKASLSYSGLAGSFVGLYEFYITVPSTLANGDYQISVTQNGTTVPQTMSLTVHN